MTANILIVDDEDDIRMMTEGILSDEGYSCIEASNAKQALELVESNTPDLVILDIWLEGSDIDGVEILTRIVEQNPHLPVVMISGHGTIETAVSTIQLGAYDFIEKPFTSDRLLVLVNRALETSRLRQENQELRLQTEQTAAELIGKTGQICQIRQAINNVAPTGSRVLITGAPGTGKEVAARLLHKMSKRSEGPFVILNCATMHPDHLEEELFGVEKMGQKKIGFLERANGGTLLLDEVSDMPFETQGKIVRILQDQRFSRVGGTELIDVDVRIFAATNQNLKEKIENGKFREDLYYRLSVVPIHMPSLSEILEDINNLVSYFSEDIAKEAGLLNKEFSDEALMVLQSYEWPGNVRQLRNVIEWTLIMNHEDQGGIIEANMLPPEITQGSSTNLDSVSNVEMFSKPLREAREIFEREYLRSQVNRFGGNISKTAGFIGMERSALHRKLKSLGIQNNNNEQEQERA